MTAGRKWKSCIGPTLCRIWIKILVMRLNLLSDFHNCLNFGISRFACFSFFLFFFLSTCIPSDFQLVRNVKLLLEHLERNIDKWWRKNIHPPVIPPSRLIKLSFEFDSTSLNCVDIYRKYKWKWREGRKIWNHP